MTPLARRFWRRWFLSGRLQERRSSTNGVSEASQREAERESPPPPAVGDEIYVDTALFVHHGRDDVRGGRARLVAVHECYHGLKGIFVEVDEHPGDLYNWDVLGRQQDKLRSEFGDQRAHPDPDLRPEFNED